MTIGFVLCENKSIAQIPRETTSMALKKLSIEELMNIEVTSVSKRSENLSEAASAIQVITQEDIRQSGYSTLPEVLRLATNLQVAQVNASQWAISARGFNNVLANKLLILIDGRVVYTPMYAGVFWDVQNLLLEDIERIEVISGPGGTLWGANAVNGVINIITKNSKDTAGLFAEAALGTELRGLGSVRYGGKIADGLTYRVYGTAFKKNNTVHADGSSPNDGWTMGQGGFRVDWTVGKKELLSLQYNAYNNRPDPDGNNPVIAKGSNVLSRWIHTTDRSDHQLQMYYDHTWRDFRNGFAEDLKTYDVEWQHHFSVGENHKIIWGVGIRAMDHKVKNIELLEFLPANKMLSLCNVFVQDEITLLEGRGRLTVGSKFEHNSYTGLQFLPSGRLAYTLAPGQTVWGAVSRAVRTPSRLDREFFLSSAPGVPSIVGGEFESEKLWAYELGWRWQPKNTFLFSLSTFYNTVDDIRTVEPASVSQPLPVTLGNGVEGHTYGAELSTTFHVKDWWRLRGGYTFLKKDLSVKSNSKDLNKGTAESNDPEHQFLIQSTISLDHTVEFGTILRFVDALPLPHVAGYVELDMRLAWRPTKAIEFSVVGQNLFDSGHTEFATSSRIPREVERSVYGKIACRL
jgi:iron complex outermembrane receptor protein